MKTLIYLLLILMVTSCEKKNKKTPIHQKSKTENQVHKRYTIDAKSISIVWTAYKFTDKVGVSGTFKDFKFETKNATGTIDSILNESSLKIPTLSVDSQNEIRDPKLRSIFFKTFHTDTIKGRILTVYKDSGLVEISMNNISKEVPYSYIVKNDSILLKTHLDLTQWNGQEAIEALNKACYELHIGPDGISKLWPDVTVEVQFPLLVRLQE
ncbi:YceI family protein [Dokdonia ponticola]|uniref:YceI family protein n=1 Tax=Dokdonia ponticola TaxID=2041041 RepID=A0ABV9HTP8_9FLAO